MTSWRPPSAETIFARLPTAWVKAKREEWDTLPSRMLLAMQPAHWYGRMDIARLAKAKDVRIARSKVNQRLKPAGWIEPARNPARGVETEPEFLYPLTPTGEAWRQRLVEMQDEAAACEK
jgi:hypothetical protein